MPVEIMYKGKLGIQVDDLVREPRGWVGVIAEFDDGSREEIEFGDLDLVVEPTQAEVDAGHSLLTVEEAVAMMVELRGR